MKSEKLTLCPAAPTNFSTTVLLKLNGVNFTQNFIKILLKILSQKIIEVMPQPHGISNYFPLICGEIRIQTLKTNQKTSQDFSTIQKRNFAYSRAIVVGYGLLC
jgi:hypothetical protein